MPEVEGQETGGEAINLTGGENEGQAAEGAINLTEPEGGAGQKEAVGDEPEGQADKGQQQQKENESEEKSSVPEKYETFSVPEGFQINETMQTELESFAKEHGMSQEAAQKVVDLGVKQMQGVIAEQNVQHEKLMNEWRSQIKSDPELGGANLNETQNRANRALSKYGTPRLVEELKRSGYTNNPELVRLLARVDKATGEDTAPNGNGGKPEGSKLTDADKLYPTMR